MREEMVSIHAPASSLPAYLVAPDSWPPGPALLVVQQWWGLDEDIKDIARRFAGEGYAALAPDLYRGLLTRDTDEAQRFVAQLYQPGALDDLRAALMWLFDRGADAAGAVGFCVGGTLTWRLAHRDDRLSAAVPFYPGRAAPEGELRCAMMLHLADPGLDIPPERVHALADHLRAQRYAHELYVYPGADHSFFNAGESYREDAAKLAWDRTLGFLRNELGEAA